MVSCVKLDAAVPNARLQQPSSPPETHGPKPGQKSGPRYTQLPLKAQTDVSPKLSQDGTSEGTEKLAGGGRAPGELEQIGAKQEQRTHEYNAGDGSGFRDLRCIKSREPKREGLSRGSSKSDSKKWRKGRGDDKKGVPCSEEEMASSHGHDRATGRNLMRPFAIDLEEEVRM